MEPLRHPAQFVRDLTHDLTWDLAPRAARRSKASATERIVRLRSRIFFILQCSIAAGVSWWLAQKLLGHTTPYLAPVAVIVCLGLTFGQRWRRVVEVTAGVAVGVLIGSVFAHLFGTGPWQIIVVAALAMAIASLLGGGVLIASQAAVQAVIVVTLVAHPELGFDRWLDALVGAVVALIAATITPASPINKPRDVASRIAHLMAGVLRDSATAYRTSDLGAATRTLQKARDSESDLAAFADATKEGLAVVRHSPLRRGKADRVEEIAALGAPLDRAVRNIRVLIRRLCTAIWRHDPVDDDVLRTIDEVAEVIDSMAEACGDGPRLEEWREQLVVLGDRTSKHDFTSLSSAVIIAQLRSIVVDLLEITGLTYEQARDRLTAYEEFGPPEQP